MHVLSFYKVEVLHHRCRAQDSVRHPRRRPQTRTLEDEDKSVRQIARRNYQTRESASRCGSRISRPPQLRTHEASCALRRGCGLPLRVSALLHRILGRAVNGDIDAAVDSKPEQQSLFQPGAPVRSAVGATQVIRRSLAQPTGLPRRRTRKRR
jgi:hypothetical protein